MHRRRNSWSETKIFISHSFYSERSKEIAEITPTIVTQGRTLTSNNNKGCCAAAHAIDRDLSTGAATHTDNGAGWLKLQFGKTHFIHKIIIYYGFSSGWYDPSNWCSQSESNFKVCVDNDNKVDVSVYQGEVKQKSCGTLQLTYGLEQSDQIYTLICNTAGDTVKLSKDTGVIAVYEVVLISTGKRYHSMLALLVAITTTSNYSYSSIFPISRTADI